MRIHLDQFLDTEPIQKAISTLREPQADQSIIDDILQTDDENLIFFDGEAACRFAPLPTSNPDQIFDDYTLYNLFTLDFKDKNVYYVTPDFNIHSNLKRLKKEVPKIKTEFIPLINPYMYGFCNDYVFDTFHTKSLDSTGPDAILKTINIINFSLNVEGKITVYEPKYNVVSLNGSKKEQRIRTIRALRNEERFVYSYYPYEDEYQLGETYDNDEDDELLNELTELNEIYNPILFMNKSEVPLEHRTKETIRKTFDSKYEAFQNSVPLEYIQSCMDLVTESYVDESIMLTEKTFKPISLRKPFLLISARHSHKFLKRLGYKLYYELFDYSFDGKSFNQRFNSIIKQIKKILSMSTQEFNAKVETIAEKIHYNQNHMINQEKRWHDAMESDDLTYLKFMINEQKIFAL